MVQNITTKPRLEIGMKTSLLTKSNNLTMMVKRVVEDFHLLKLLLPIKRVTNKFHGLLLRMEILDGVIILWFKTLKLRGGCALILEIRFQMLKKDIK